MVEIFYVSGIVGVLSQIYRSMETAYIVLIILIVIDTITGMTAAVKYKRFNSKGVGKFTKKVIIYTLCIITVRLLEIGMLSLVQMTLLSQVTIAVLQLKETVSALENLALLGVPIPINIISVLTNYLKVPGLQQALDIESHEQKYIEEIEEIIKHQIPIFEDMNMRKILEINFRAWKDVVIHIINDFDHDKKNDNVERFRYKLLALIQLELNEMEKEWERENIPKAYIDKFYICYEEKINMLIYKIQSIFSAEEKIQVKKEQIIDIIIAHLYQMVLEARKCAYQVTQER